VQYFQTAEDLGLYGSDPTITTTKDVYVATGALTTVMCRQQNMNLSYDTCWHGKLWPHHDRGHIGLHQRNRDTLVSASAAATAAASAGD
jgi:hypothetical protein